MTPIVLFAGEPQERDAWLREVARAAAEESLEIDLRADPSAATPAEVDYLLFAPKGPIADLAPYTGLKAILSLWAGVESLMMRTDLPRAVPVTRMAEPGLTIGMTDYVVANVLRAHMGLDQLVDQSREGRWKQMTPPLSINRSVGVMGLGALGLDAAEMLATLRFQVAGWSRTPKRIDDVVCYAGLESLEGFLARSEILVLLLPQTPETIGLLSAERLARLPAGAHIVNAARGPILPEADLLAALDSGHLGGATLDVFDVEPLPEEHPYWSHPRVTVTPHIASITRPETASKELVNQIKRHMAGAPLQNVVDFNRGY